MTKRKAGLGRGLEALLGAEQPPVNASSLPSVLPLAVLQAGKYQPRTRMDEGALAELAESIKAQGVMQPVLVRSAGEGRYEIIAGERRVRAAAIAGLDEIPVLVRDVPDESAAVMALIENIQREDLNPLEEAHGVQRLIHEFRLTHENAAAAIGRSRSATSNLLRLLNLAKPSSRCWWREISTWDTRARCSRSPAPTRSRSRIRSSRSVCRSETPSGWSRAPAARKLSRHRVGVNRPSAVVTSRGSKRNCPDRLATTVKIRMRGKGRGCLVVDFADLEQLDGVLERIRGASA